VLLHRDNNTDYNYYLLLHHHARKHDLAIKY
jgi:hypothetical protein